MNFSKSKIAARIRSENATPHYLAPGFDTHFLNVKLCQSFRIRILSFRVK